jgi:hypothetical protein
MTVNKRFAAVVATAALMLAAAADAGQPRSSDKAAGSEVGEYQRDVERYAEAALVANAVMAGPNMDSNPHIFMTVLEPKNQDDDRRAGVILDILRKALDKYKDYRVAEANGYHVLMPNVAQPQYHFTNRRYAFAAAFLFNPAHPTSLLYKKTKDGYELQGALFTAPKDATKKQLDERIPLSVARWHEHVNMCMPAKDTPAKEVNWKEFGLSGSIATRAACAQAGGRWIPQVFGWMAHVYPFETDPDKIWGR